MTPLPQLLTPQELCDYLGFSPSTLRKNLQAGMPFFRVSGRKKLRRLFKVEEVLEWMAVRTSLKSLGTGATDGPDLSRAR